MKGGTRDVRRWERSGWEVREKGEGCGREDGRTQGENLGDCWVRDWRKVVGESAPLVRPLIII